MEITAIRPNAMEPWGDTQESNYVVRVRELIGKILAQFSQIAERDRTQKKAQEEKFIKANKESGEYLKEMGDRGFTWTAVALGLMGSQLLLPAASGAIGLGDEQQKLCQQVVSYLSDHGCTSLSNMFNSETQYKQKQIDAISQLAMTEINAMAGKNSSDASSKQELIEMLNKVLQSVRDAARGAG